MAKDCLYCGLQFAESTQFCPNCGRPTESGFIIHPLQESEVDCLRRELQEKEELLRQLVPARTWTAILDEEDVGNLTPERKEGCYGL